VVIAVLVSEFGNPLCTRAIEDEFGLISIRLCELLRCFKCVYDSANVFVSFRPCQNDDWCFRYVSYRGSYGPKYTRQPPGKSVTRFRVGCYLG
jgi:hypothetical protein